MKTYTAFCQEDDGRGTIWIATVQARTVASAIKKARRDCAADWGYAVDRVHCLGLAEGDCKIVHWEDLDT